MVAIRRTSDDMKETLECLSGKLPETRRRGVGKWMSAPRSFRVPDIGCPTSAPPGTAEKLEVMIMRETRQEPIFHAYDARWDGDIRPLLWYMRKYDVEGGKLEIA